MQQLAQGAASCSFIAALGPSAVAAPAFLDGWRTGLIAPQSEKSDPRVGTGIESKKRGARKPCDAAARRIASDFLQQRSDRAAPIVYAPRGALR